MSEPTAPPRKFAIIAAFAALYLIWGSTYLGILFAIESIPPLLMAGTRFFLAGIIMYAIARWQGAPRSTFAEWRTALIVGACLLFCGNGSVTLVEQWVPSGLASLLVATVPIYIALLAWLSGSAPRPGPLVLLGLAGGFAGVGILVGPALTTPPAGGSQHLGAGMLILLFGSLLWSIGSLYSRRAPSAISPFLSSAQTMLCGGGLMMLAGFGRGEARTFRLSEVTALSLGAFAYLVLVGAIVGYTAYIWLLRHCDPAKVATYAYVNPVVPFCSAPFLRAKPFRFAPPWRRPSSLGRSRSSSPPNRRGKKRRCSRGRSCTTEAKAANTGRMKRDDGKAAARARRDRSGAR